jgi:hypothetical protein
MTTLTDFLLARIAEDEERAKMARGWQTGSRHEGQPLDWSIHMDRWSPDRVLAECAAKRRTVEAVHPVVEYESYEGPDYYGGTEACETTLRALASVYADHPDYREEWA